MNKKVIIADDDAQIRKVLKQALLHSEYQIVAEATNGLDLLEKCTALIPDVAIVDIQMPTMDGISATKMIIEESKAKCVIILTSFDEQEYVSRAINAGVSGYLTKPLDLDMLIPTIESALFRSKQLYEKHKELNKTVKRKQSLKYIDKAKLCLMESRDVSEETAYMMMKEISKKNQLRLESVARIIIAKWGKSND